MLTQNTFNGMMWTETTFTSPSLPQQNSSRVPFLREALSLLLIGTAIASGVLGIVLFPLALLLFLLMVPAGLRIPAFVYPAVLITGAGALTMSLALAFRKDSI